MQYPAWHRLAYLSHLQLSLPRVIGHSALHMSILAAIPSLTSFSLQVTNSATGSGYRLIDSDSDDEVVQWQPQMLYTPSYTHMGITRLELGYDPFCDGLKLNQLPCLQVLHRSTDCLPSWLRGQALETLQVAWPHQTDRFDTRELLCRRIEVIACNLFAPWKLSSLLAMPSLTEVSFSIDKQISHCKEGAINHISLQGSCRDHQIFLWKVEIQCKAPVDLRITNNNGCVTSTAELQSNGHAVACPCYKCRK